MVDTDHRFSRDPAPADEPDIGSTTIHLAADGDVAPTIDPASGAMKVETGDGGVVIELFPGATPRKKDDGGDFYANLAELIDPSERARIGEDTMQGIEADDRSRQEYLETRAKGIEMLGFKLEQPRGDTGASTAPVEGMSTVRHPELAEAVIRFQSNASAELLPAEGPVKVRNDAPPEPDGADQAEQTPGIGDNGGPPLDDDKPPSLIERIGKFISGDKSEPDDEAPVPTPPGVTPDDLAEALEKDFNHFLTVVDKGYRPDTDRMLFWVGFGGCGFKKIYNDPVRKMPISRSVDAADLIVSDAANDIDDAGRVTHRIRMRKSTLVRMQLAGVYRKTPLTSPAAPVHDIVEGTKREIQGFQAPQRTEDYEYTIYESYVELDVKGFEHRDEEGNVTGLPVPYRVTIEKDSREVLEIRRNWNDGDDNYLQKKVFVKFPFIPAMGFYDVGLLQVLGNTTTALTAAWRLMLDAGMFSSFPGFLYADIAGRQQTNEFRVPPGGGVRIQTGGKPIQDAVLPLPYKEPSQALGALVGKIEEMGQRVGGTAELQVSEGRQDAPVGTTLALIEQATKMLAAVHVRLHAAQSEEFQLLKERFRENPEAFWRGRRTARKWRADEFLAALDNHDLVPAADPNTPSHMHRIMKAVAVKQLQAMNPWLYDPQAVDTAVLHMIGFADASSLFNKNPQPPQAAQPPVDPSRMAAVQLKAAEIGQQAQARQQEQQADAAKAVQQATVRAREAQVESADRSADRASREKVAQIREETERIKAIGDLISKGVPLETAIQVMNSARQPPIVPGAPAPPPAGFQPPAGMPPRII